MIQYLKGDILSSKCQTLTCTVNCVGVMGKGLALEFKKTFPDLEKAYAEACAKGVCRIGKPWIWKATDVRQVLCFPTKDHWKRPSTYEYVKSGLLGLLQLHLKGEIHSLAVPPLGCGLGGLEWAVVKPMIAQYLGDLSIEIEVYEPA